MMFAVTIAVCTVIGLFICFVAVLTLKETIAHKRMIKQANESEIERKRQNKTIDEWYVKGKKTI